MPMPCRHEADFALQAHVECCAFEPERIVRSVLLRWQSSGNEVRRGLAVGPVEKEDVKTRRACGSKWS